MLSLTSFSAGFSAGGATSYGLVATGGYGLVSATVFLTTLGYSTTFGSGLTAVGAGCGAGVGTGSLGVYLTSLTSFLTSLISKGST